MAGLTRAGYSRVINPMKKTLEAFHLRSMKSIKFTFDPYHPNIRSMRECLFLIKQARILKTNLNCATKVDVKSNRCDPEINIAFIDDHKVKFKTSELTTLDILQRLHEFSDEKDPKKNEKVVVMTKAKKRNK
ncbi:probable 39S ribosomal protein L53, mitochondrial [Mytilus californianus]|uniref:probable 39S ribosomal protein L53, mitochondrial n=1 Tax=Mytilus californianus TaxID=6549 RepID=UPI0022458A1C|nr:probable 39S ribosomal protein L53, mitochondrial [Mytilus californianus]